MLRLREKPSADRPNVNSGQPWSATDLADLQDLLNDGRTVGEIASHLGRPVEEVEAKVRSLRN
jgi:hypothetical protein